MASNKTLLALAIALAATPAAAQQPPASISPQVRAAAAAGLPPANPAWILGHGRQNPNAPIRSSLLFDNRATLNEVVSTSIGHAFTFRFPISGPLAINGSCSTATGPAVAVDGSNVRPPPGDGPLGIYVEDIRSRTTFAAGENAGVNGSWSIASGSVPAFVRFLGDLPFGRIVTIGLVRGDKAVPMMRYTAPGPITARQVMYEAQPARIDFMRQIDQSCQSLLTP